MFKPNNVDLAAYKVMESLKQLDQLTQKMNAADTDPTNNGFIQTGDEYEH